MFWAFRLDFVIWYPMYIFYLLFYLLFILFTNTRLATCAGQLVDFPVLIKKLLLSFIPSSPYTFNYDELYSKWAQWGLGFASFWTKKMVYKTDQTLFRWLFGFQNGSESSLLIPSYRYLGEEFCSRRRAFSPLRQTLNGTVDEEIWTWKEISVFFSVDVLRNHSFVFIDCSCLPNVRHALKWMGGKDVCQVTKTGIPRGGLGV